MYQFDEVYQKVKEVSKFNFDKSLALSDLEFNVNDTFIHKPTKNEVVLTDYSKNQLLSRLNFNIGDFGVDSPEIQVDRLNYRLKKSKEVCLFRMRKNGHNKLRAIVSLHRYQKFDVIDMLDNLADSMGIKELENNFSFDCNISDGDFPDDFKLSVIRKDMEKKIKESNCKLSFGFGVSIFTSEICRLATFVDRMIMRLVCTNGMILRETEKEDKHKHTLNIISWFKGKIGKVFDNIKDDSFENVINNYKQAESIYFDSILETENTVIAILKYLEIPYTKHYTNICDVIKIKYPEYSLQSVLNGLTDYAHNLPTFQRQYLEKGVGDLLLVPHRLDSIITLVKNKSFLSKLGSPSDVRN